MGLSASGEAQNLERVHNLRARTACRTSKAVLKTENPTRTVPERSVPADSCASGAQ